MLGYHQNEVAVGGDYGGLAGMGYWIVHLRSFHWCSGSWDESRIWFLFGLVSSRVMGLASWQWWELCWYELDIGDALFNAFTHLWWRKFGWQDWIHFSMFPEVM
jgi:hypothetical protein